MRVLITGGAGFVGTNLAAAMAEQGAEVRVVDNLSRVGVSQNAAWLRSTYPQIEIRQEDVRDAAAMLRAVEGVDQVFHLAAQVAVTTSVTDPRTDFEINLAGTVNTLEAVRQAAPGARFFYTSTNKVYGGMEDVGVEQCGERYEYVGLPEGVSEERILDFHSPYGCSKGAADQYVRDYHRIYGIPSTVFRMSCIYGPHQCGNEDQGWVAHFARTALEGGTISIYGDGRQVRDVLYVDDLVRAFLMAAEKPDRTAGRIYNIGGGSRNTISLLELIALLEQRCGRPLSVRMGDWRPGDQRIYVSDVRRAASEFGWAPRLSPAEGIALLLQWLEASRPALASVV